MASSWPRGSPGSARTRPGVRAGRVAETVHSEPLTRPERDPEWVSSREAHQGTGDVPAVGTVAVGDHAPGDRSGDEDPAIGGEDAAEVVVVLPGRHHAVEAEGDDSGADPDPALCSRMPCQTSQAPPISNRAARTNRATERATTMAPDLTGAADAGSTSAGPLCGDVRERLGAGFVSRSSRIGDGNRTSPPCCRSAVPPTRRSGHSSLRLARRRGLP